MRGVEGLTILGNAENDIFTIGDLTGTHAVFICSTADHTLYYDGPGAVVGDTMVATVQNGEQIPVADIQLTHAA